jgi:hypothetical protein
MASRSLAVENVSGMESVPTGGNDDIVDNARATQRVLIRQIGANARNANGPSCEV